MKPDSRFLRQPKEFWANIRTISEQIGYTDRGNHQIMVPDPGQIKAGLDQAGLSYAHLMNRKDGLTPLGRQLRDYFQYRAWILNNRVERCLMNANEAEKLFKQLQRNLRPKCPLPMNKQKGNKKAHAYLTCIVNMLIEKHAGSIGCDYDPRQLTTVTRNGRPFRTLARRVDGAFPSVVDPVAVWEIKEYYYTTTFGSRVADGIYESLLDGMELEELREKEQVNIKHYLIVDAHYTWWECGRSYLCRIIDMLHMGYADEVLFGREVVESIPRLAKEWVKEVRLRQGK